MKRRIAVLALVVGFLAAPGLGPAAMDSCPLSCPQHAEEHCEIGEAPCASLTAVPCCDGAPVAPASQAKRSIDPPSLQPVTFAARLAPVVSAHTRAPGLGGDLAVSTSPLRLSVVLLI